MMHGQQPHVQWDVAGLHGGAVGSGEGLAADVALAHAHLGALAEIAPRSKPDDRR
jgi:hypothetical protein